MSETTPSETKPKKMVRRSVAIALGIAAIVLLAGLGGALAYYNGYVNGHHNADEQYNSLQSQLNNLTNIVNFANVTEWLNPEVVTVVLGSYASWNFSASFAGYVVVDLGSAFSGYVQVTYTSYVGSRPVPFQYDQRIDLVVGVSYHIFPVFPATVQIRVGNTGLYPDENATQITINYY